VGGFATGLSSGAGAEISGNAPSKDDSKDNSKEMESERFSASAAPPSYKRGGKVKRSGKARVHKGERVLTKAQAKRYEKRKRGRK